MQQHSRRISRPQSQSLSQSLSQSQSQSLLLSRPMSLHALQEQRDIVQKQLLATENDREYFEELIKQFQKQLSPILQQEYSLHTKLEEIDYQLDDKTKELWWQSQQIDLYQITTQQLASLPASMIDLIVQEKYRVEKLKFYSSLGTESGRPELKLSEKKYVESVIYRITKHESCRYCHSIFHMKDACPDLKKKKCAMCYEEGHDQFHCTKQVKDLYRRPSKKYSGRK
jgi:hypothetical protein